MSTEIDTEELLREIERKLYVEEWCSGEVWFGLLRRAAEAIDKLHKQVEVERNKGNFLAGLSCRLLDERDAERDDHR